MKDGKDMTPGGGNILRSEKYRKRAEEKARREQEAAEAARQAKVRTEPLADAADIRRNAGVMDSIAESGAQNINVSKFHASQGHGFAAEQANTFLDRMHGLDAHVVGNDNAANGADRLVDGRLIQVKYCQNAAASVDAAFENHEYRYYDVHGKPMQIEVPSDQYEQAVANMRERIAKGEVKGVTDPNDAKKLVRKGSVTYETAKRIAQAGTVESLTFDAVQGAVIATGVFGISGTITFAKALWDGKNMDDAVDEGLCTGLSAAGTCEVSYILTQQLTRCGASALLAAPAKGAVKLLPVSVRKALLDGLKNGAPAYGAAAGNLAKTEGTKVTAQTATNELAQLLRGNVIAAAATVLVLSAGDIVNCFRGRISGRQLFKNLTVATGAVGGGAGGMMAGALAGGAVGSLLGPGGTVAGAKVGAFLGGIAGGAVGGSATKAAMDSLIEDDAVQLVRIIESHIVPLAQTYLLNEEELSIVLDDLQRVLTQGKLYEMYAAGDREAFADELLTALIRRTIGFRTRVRLPTGEAAAESLLRLMARSEAGQPLLVPQKKADPEAVARAVLGRDVSRSDAKKAWYVTKQMHNVTKQQEQDLFTMKASEKDVASENEPRRQRKAHFEEMIKNYTGNGEN